MDSSNSQHSNQNLYESLATQFFKVNRWNLPLELTARLVALLFLAVEAARCSRRLRVSSAPYRHAWQRLMQAGFSPYHRDALMRAGVQATLAEMPHIGGQSGDFIVDTQPLVDELIELRSKPPRQLGIARGTSAERRLDERVIYPAARLAASDRRVAFASLEHEGRILHERHHTTADELERDHSAMDIRASAEVLAAHFLDEHRQVLPAGLTQRHVDFVFYMAEGVNQTNSSMDALQRCGRVWEYLRDAGFPVEYMHALRTVGIDPLLERTPALNTAANRLERDTERPETVHRHEVPAWLKTAAFCTKTIGRGARERRPSEARYPSLSVSHSKARNTPSWDALTPRHTWEAGLKSLATPLRLSRLVGDAICAENAELRRNFIREVESVSPKLSSRSATHKAQVERLFRDLNQNPRFVRARYTPPPGVSGMGRSSSHREPEAHARALAEHAKNKPDDTDGEPVAET